MKKRRVAGIFEFCCNNFQKNVLLITPGQLGPTKREAVWVLRASTTRT